MTRLRVAMPSNGYDVLVFNGLLADVEALRVAHAGSAERCVVVTDANVEEAGHTARLLEALAEAGLDASLIVIPPGESNKTLDVAATVYDGCVDAGLDRSGTVFTLGGGVVGDLGGFVAATYMRGVRLVHVPTTLLAMVDAAIGGKTGLDMPRGKNLVGAFKQPSLVLVDPTVLTTLDPAELRAGAAEIVKHAILGAPDLFDAMERQTPAALVDGVDSANIEELRGVIIQAARVKIDVVETDPHERGHRAVLNLGHTFGHAFEVCSDFRIRHGHAVAVGLVAAARLSRSLGRCDAELPRRIAALLEKLELPVRFDGLEANAVLGAMAHDKKRRGGRLRVILPDALGRVAIVEQPDTHLLRDAIESVL